MRHFIGFLIFCCGIHFCVHAQPGAAEKNSNVQVDSFIHQQMRDKHTTGLTLAVMRDNKLLYTNSYGYSNLEHKVPAINETVYSIMSITKSFTAIATMMLMEEGKLSLEDPIAKFIDSLPSAWKKITIRQLLNHTSGISGFAGHQQIPCSVGKHVRDYVRGDMLKEVACLPLDFTPGDKWSYGDTNFYLLGMLVEKLTGKTYEQFVHERIFLPLEMSKSRGLSYTDLIPNRADGYAYKDDSYYARRFETDEFANAGILSTVVDMIKLHHAFTSDILLKKSTWQQMWKNARLNNGEVVNFGLGFGLTPFQGRRRVGHYGGGGLGFAGGISHFLDQNLTVVVLTNTDHPDIGTLVNTVASFYFK
jgi:CubicO group peptidase (beta-lactamase class C family)